MSDRSDRPTPTPVSPRPGAGAASDEAVREMQDLLERYAGRTPLTPRPDWMSQVHMRVHEEGARSPSSRFALAVRDLSPREAMFAFRASLAAAFGQGSFPAAARAQAMALVLLVVLSVGALGAGGAVVVDTVIRPPAPRQPVSVTHPSPTPSRHPAPTSLRSTEPDNLPPAELPSQPSTAPSDPVVAVPTPSWPAAGDRGPGGVPDVHATPQSHPTPKPHPTPKKPHPTPKADKTPKPDPTPKKPHPTPKKPHPTPKVARTPKPNPIPKLLQTPKPHTSPGGRN